MFVELEVELAAGATVATLWATLCQRFPQLEPLSQSLSFAVNQQYVERSALLAPADAGW